jgi:hypothetical protein
VWYFQERSSSEMPPHLQEKMLPQMSQKEEMPFHHQDELQATQTWKHCSQTMCTLRCKTKVHQKEAHRKNVPLQSTCKRKVRKGINPY